MTSRLALLALLVGCAPKTGTTTSPVPTTSVAAPEAAPAAPASVATPEATPAPAAGPTETTGTAVATPATAPAIQIAQKDGVARRVNDAAAMLTTGDASRAQRAIEILQGELADNPQVAAIHYNIGVAHQLLGQEAEARRAWTRATEVDPTFAKAWHNLGVANAAGGRLDLALASFQAGTRYNPNSIDLRVASIAALRQLKRYDEAIAEAKAALFINSKAIPIYNDLAMVYLDTNRYDLARFTLEKALADIDGAKGNARLHAVLGEVYYRLGYTGDAVQSFQKSLELDPYQLPALLYLAGYHMDNRSWTDATPLLERAMKVAPNDAGIQLNLGICYRGEGRFEDAKRAYNEALRLRPKDPEPYRNLAVLYGDYMKAYDAALQSIEDYRRAGGGPASELDAWIASIKKEQERIEKQRLREERQRKEAEEARKKEEGGLFGPPDGGPPDGSAPTSGQSAGGAPAPAPEQPAQPAPAQPAPAQPEQPPAQPAQPPPSESAPSPWG